MKVLHVFNEIKFSGAELMYVKAASFFQKNGIEMYAISTGQNLGDFATEFTNNNIKVFYRPIKSEIRFSLNRILYYYDFYKFLKEEKIDVLHIHRSDLFLLAFISRILKIPTVKTIHNVFKNRAYTRFYAIFKRWLARNVSNVIFQTIGQSVYQNELIYYKNPSIIINNWYDSKRFYPLKNKEEKQLIRKKLNINKDVFVIVSVGGCSNVKNHEDIINALNLVKSQIDINYLHLGTGSIEKDEKKLVGALGLQSQVYFLGNKNNVQDYLAVSDLYLQPSKHEGLSIACLEAMACGIPSILYDVPGLRDLIKENDNGFLINANYHLLAEKILEYKNNPDLLTAKGNSALKFVNENYSMKTNVKKMIDLYNQISILKH
jgi:glycosyltransferase involved in cell wall biosynthesis